MLKKIKAVQWLYDRTRSIITRFSPTLTSKITYGISYKKKLDLKNPQDFNQKIMWLKLRKYGNDLEVSRCVDKYAVREYVIEHGCGEILNDIIGVYNSVEEIPWDELPQQFALKLTHSCGANLICSDKSTLDIEDAKKKLKKWYKQNYYLTAAEMQYKHIPKRILCEKYIESCASAPTDYKFFCYYGKPELAIVIADRHENMRVHFYDLDWNFLGAEGEAGELIKKPSTLNEMIEVCQKLATQFPFVRVDLYEVDGKVMFGEMTFTPAGGIGKSYPEHVYRRLNEAFVLPTE